MPSCVERARSGRAVARRPVGRRPGGPIVTPQVVSCRLCPMRWVSGLMGMVSCRPHCATARARVSPGGILLGSRPTPWDALWRVADQSRSRPQTALISTLIPRRYLSRSPGTASSDGAIRLEPRSLDLCRPRRTTCVVRVSPSAVRSRSRAISPRRLGAT